MIDGKSTQDSQLIPKALFGSGPSFLGTHRSTLPFAIYLHQNFLRPQETEQLIPTTSNPCGYQSMAKSPPNSANQWATLIADRHPVEPKSQIEDETDVFGMTIGSASELG